MTTVPEGFVEVTVRVPAKCKPVITAMARELNRMDDPPVNSVREVVSQGLIETIVERYMAPGWGPQKMARDAGSRSRDWFVVVRQGQWPLKALYFLFMQIVKPGTYNEAREFHTQEARDFMAGLGYVVENVKKDGKTDLYRKVPPSLGSRKSD